MKTCLALLTMLAAGHLQATEVQGRAFGDDSRSPKSGVTVYLISKTGGGKVARVTDGKGVFQFSQVAAGTYELKYELRQHAILKESEQIEVKTANIAAAPVIVFPRAVPPDARKVQVALNLRAKATQNPAAQFENDKATAVTERLITNSQAAGMKLSP